MKNEFILGPHMRNGPQSDHKIELIPYEDKNDHGPT